MSRQFSGGKKSFSTHGAEPMDIHVQKNESTKVKKKIVNFLIFDQAVIPYVTLKAQSNQTKNRYIGFH